MEPAAFLAEAGLDGVDERGQVVAGRALELGDPLGCRGTRVLAHCAGGLRRQDSQLGPGVERGELDVQPRSRACSRPTTPGPSPGGSSGRSLS